MRAYLKLGPTAFFAFGFILATMGIVGPFSSSLLSPAFAAEVPTTVLIIQHAERFDFTNTKDPELTPVGKQRAQDLVHAVGNAGIAAVFSPKAKRMVETVEPLMHSLNLPELNYYDQENLGPMIKQIRDQYNGRTVLIVGAGSHMGSGGIHDTIKALGCTGPECEVKDGYDNLLAVTLYDPARATMEKLRYGKPAEPQK